MIGCPPYSTQACPSIFPSRLRSPTKISDSRRLCSRRAHRVSDLTRQVPPIPVCLRTIPCACRAATIRAAGAGEAEGTRLTETAHRRRKRIVRTTPNVLMAVQITMGRTKASRMSHLRRRSKRQRVTILFTRDDVQELQIESFGSRFRLHILRINWNSAARETRNGVRADSNPECSFSPGGR